MTLIQRADEFSLRLEKIDEQHTETMGRLFGKLDKMDVARQEDMKELGLALEPFQTWVLQEQAVLSVLLKIGVGLGVLLAGGSTIWSILHYLLKVL